MKRGELDAQAAVDALGAVAEWLRNDGAAAPDRALIATAVRVTARALEAAAPGASVEVRIPPFVAIQCVSGPRHSRGTPPNVVETDPRTWLRLAVGLVDFESAVTDGRLIASGVRVAELKEMFPLFSASFLGSD